MARTRKKTTRTTPSRSRTAKKEIVATTGSYTSLLYGIITVGIIFLMFFLLLRLFAPKHNTGTITKEAAKTSVIDEKRIAENITPNITLVATESAQVTPTSTPTLIKASSTPTTIKSSPTPTPTKAVVKEQPKENNQKQNQKEYTVQSGDNLWKISEKVYKSGYNWISIARANNISDPGVIHSGTKLVIPDVTPILVEKTEKVENKQPQKVEEKSKVNETGKITGTSYTIQKGDDLWGIAVRAYGDGYKWVDIARANNLSDPNLIHSQNTLKIPR